MTLENEERQNETVREVTTNSLPAQKPDSSDNPPSKGLIFILGILGILGVAALIGYFFITRQVREVSTHPFILKTAKTFSLPAAKVDGRKVLYSDYVTDRETLRKFYEQNKGNTAEATEQQISDQALTRLLINEVIKKLADQYSVAVEPSDLEAEKSTLISQFENEAAAEEELQKQYGWKLSTYMERIVKPYLLEGKVQKAFAVSTDDFGKPYEENEVKARHILFPVVDETKEKDVLKQAEKILARAKQGEDFGELAKQYTVESEREAGGDLGWFGSGVMVPEFEQAALALETGEISEPIKTTYGYHIIKVEEKRSVRSFNKLMADILPKVNVRMYINVNNPFDTYKKDEGAALQ